MLVMTKKKLEKQMRSPRLQLRGRVFRRRLEVRTAAGQLVELVVQITSVNGSSMRQTQKVYHASGKRSIADLTFGGGRVAI